MKKLLLFAIPVILYITVPLFVMIRTGELNEYQTIADKHLSQPRLQIGLAYSNPDKFLKLITTKKRKPTILALGTSRVMQIRSFFFNDSVNFYNAGGGIEKIRQYEYFIDQIPVDAQPKLLIIGLDQYFFNKKWDNLSKLDFSGEYKDRYSFLGYLFNNSVDVWKDVFSSKIKKDLLFNHQNSEKIGVNALLNNNGFVSDGSYYYGGIYKDSISNPDYQFKNTLQRISNGNKRFEYGDIVNEESLIVLDNFLSKCKKRGIYVIGIIPPYGTLIYNKLKELRNDKYKYIFEIEEKIAPIFNKHSFEYYNYSDISVINASDKEMIDGIHGSDKTYLRMMLDMYGKSPSLKQYANGDKLNSLLKNAISDLQVLPY